MITLKVEVGALVEVPCYQTNHRAKNWCAEISRAPDKPGGLARDWWQPAKGEFYYHVPKDVAAGVPLEFGADSYSRSGMVSRHRQWFLIVGVQPHLLALEEYSTARKAIRAADNFDSETIILPPEKPIIMERPAVGDVHACAKIQSLFMHLVYTEQGWMLNQWAMKDQLLSQVHYCPGCGANLGKP